MDMGVTAWRDKNILFDKGWERVWARGHPPWRGVPEVRGISSEVQPRPEGTRLRLTTPKLKCVWGPFRSG